MADKAQASTGKSLRFAKSTRRRANATVKVIESAPIQRSAKRRDPERLKQLLSGLTTPRPQ